jgi:PAS domain S-box-containing protein
MSLMSTPPLRVLLVDADPDAIERSRALLLESTSECALTIARSAREGIDILLTGDFNAAIVGYRLGSISALDLLEEIRRAGRRTPVIIVTEHFDPVADSEAGIEGADDYLCHDELTPRLLLRSIRQAGERLRIERERDHLLQLVQYESDFLESLITGIPGVVWERRGGEDILSHRITFMSDYVETLVGYTSRELRLIGIKWSELIHPDDRERVRATILAHQPPGSYHFTYRILARDGRIVWIDSNVVSSIADDGEIVERGIALDITEQRRAEEALRENEERFRVALTASSLAVFSMDRDLRYTWAYNSINPPESIIGRRDTELLDEGNAAIMTGIKKKVLDSGVRCHEEVMLELEGMRKYFDVVIEPLFGHNGEVVGITGAAFDLTSVRLAEEELRRSQELFNTFMDNSPALAFIKDARGRYIFVNRKAASVLGRTPDEIIGRTSRELLSTEDLLPLQEADRQVLENERTVEGIVTLGPSEDRRYWHSVKFPIRSSEGEPMIGGKLIEITDQVAAETLLRRSEERFQLAMRATNDVIWDWDLASGSLWMSENVATVFDYPHGEIRASIDWRVERIDPDQRREIGERITRAIADGETFWSAEYRFMRGDGSYADVLDRGYIVHDDDGRPVRMLGAMIDITARKESEKALIESQSRLQSLFEHAQDTILLASDDARYVDVNPAACALTGYDRDELLTLSVFDLAAEENREELRSRWKEFIETGVQTGDIPLLRKDGTLVITEFRAVANIIPGLHLSIMRDITERVRTRELLQEANDKLERRVEERTEEIVRVIRRLEQTNLVQKRFIADASHDLRTPLTVLRAELELLRRGSSDPRLLESLGKLSREAQRLDTLITDLLVLATLEGRDGKPGRQPVRVDELILEGASQLATLAAEKEIKWRIISEEPIEITGDEMTIKRMLDNLMENAVKYSRQRGIVEISLARIPSEGKRNEHIEIIIRDNGAGIAEHDLPRVFDRFYRGDITRSTPGTGLGLAIVKAAVDAHGGEITIESTVDVGTTVTVRLEETE